VTKEQAQWVAWQVSQALAGLRHAEAAMQALGTWAGRFRGVDLKVNAAGGEKIVTTRNAERYREYQREYQREYRRRKRAKERGDG